VSPAWIDSAGLFLFWAHGKQQPMSFSPRGKKVRVREQGDQAMTDIRQQPACETNKLQLFVYALCASLFSVWSVAHAQQPPKIPRIGWLSGSSRSAIATRSEAFRQGLRELGYVEGKNIIVEWRYGEGKPARVSEFAAELVHLNVDVIVSAGPTPTRFAKHSTTTIPIVMAQDGDPVGNGFVISLARPGGNITGLSRLTPDISGKQLELLKEIVPKVSRVAVFGTSTQPGNAQTLTEINLAAKTLGVEIRYFDVLGAKDIETGFGTASKRRADAILWFVAGLVGTSQRKKVVDLTVKNKLPAIYNQPGYVEAGGLMTYGMSISDLDRRAATYVDKILKGAKPADLPVEQPTKFDLVINLKAAKQIGLTIPPNVLARADRVIR
jgi:putative tryptophan/tyrosine transport system substrate-binding protein